MAVTDFYLKIDGIDGESQDGTQKGEIDLESWSWGCTQSANPGGGGQGGGKVHMQEFNFSMKVNKATPKLIEACASGKAFGSAALNCRKAGGKQDSYLIYKFYDVMISSYHTTGSGGSGIVPTEQISFNYGKMEVEYKEQKSDGTMGGAVRCGWDSKKNEKC